MLLRNSFRTKRNPICGELFKTSSLQNHKRTHTKRKFSKFLPDRFLTWKFILQFFSQITFGRVYSTAIDPILSRTSKAPTAIPILEKILQKHTKNHTEKKIQPVRSGVSCSLDNPQSFGQSKSNLGPTEKEKKETRGRNYMEPHGPSPQGAPCRVSPPSTLDSIIGTRFRFINQMLFLSIWPNTF